MNEEVEEVWAMLVEHLADRFDPSEAVNRATDILAKYYLKIEGQGNE